jgi:gluconate 2-dehydrogenase gamma chain
VQAHLFPAEPGAPGAAQIQALGYLRATLEIPSFDAAERSAVLDGAGEIERLAQTQVGRSFAELAEPEREAVLRAYEATDAGRRWLAGILGYLLEALLGAPAYGGNPDGIGWRWLEHNPGFPLPTPAKRYYLL